MSEKPSQMQMDEDRETAGALGYLPIAWLCEKPYPADFPSHFPREREVTVSAAAAGEYKAEGWSITPLYRRETETEGQQRIDEMLPPDPMISVWTRGIFPNVETAHGNAEPPGDGWTAFYRRVDFQRWREWMRAVLVDEVSKHLFYKAKAAGAKRDLEIERSTLHELADVERCLRENGFGDHADTVAKFAMADCLCADLENCEAMPGHRCRQTGVVCPVRRVEDLDIPGMLRGEVPISSSPASSEKTPTPES